MGGVVAHPGEPLDHQGDAFKGPQLADKPVGGRTLAQRLLDGGECRAVQPRGGAGRAAAAQRVGSAGVPAVMPSARGLAGDAELAGEFGLVDAGGEQFGGAQPAPLELVAVVLGLGWWGVVATGTSCTVRAAAGAFCPISPARQLDPHPLPPIPMILFGRLPL